MRSFIYIMIIIVLSVLSGCATPQREVKMIQITPQMPSVITYPSDVRGTYVVRDDSALKFCAEPAPDVALESIQKLAANLKATFAAGQPIDASISGELAVKVIELAGRTQLLLIAREMLYRACEMSLNHPAKLSDAMGMYKIVVELIKDLGQAEKTHADANLKRREAELNNAKAALEKVLKGAPN
jgi:hypothetical protein